MSSPQLSADAVNSHHHTDSWRLLYQLMVVPHVLAGNSPLRGKSKPASRAIPVAVHE
jgi:hypothetical protein